MKFEDARKGMRVRIHNPPKRFPADPGIGEIMHKYFGKIYEITEVQPDGVLILKGIKHCVWHVRWVDKVCKLNRHKRDTN